MACACALAALAALGALTTGLTVCGRSQAGAGAAAGLASDPKERRQVQISRLKQEMAMPQGRTGGR